MSACYERLWRANRTADFVHPEADLSRYRLVVVPSLYLTTPPAAGNLGSYVAGGGTVRVSFFSGIADANDAIPPGRHPGALRELLGLGPPRRGGGVVRGPHQPRRGGRRGAGGPPGAGLTPRRLTPGPSSRSPRAPGRRTGGRRRPRSRGRSGRR
ncbi:MAG TPA: beta-galactosidase trimerization domain-containing protein [Candidatus Dormibacteraeota bacterium]|nr:beta-galactosidase trimerization domain-containing protein [Candidatus Dormibacteraeota bacterium]